MSLCQGNISATFAEKVEVEWPVEDFMSEHGISDFDCYKSPEFLFAQWTWQIFIYRDAPLPPPKPPARNRRPPRPGIGFIVTRLKHLPCNGACDQCCVKEDARGVLGLKKADNTVERIREPIYFGKNFHSAVKKSLFLNRRHELAPDNTITLTCSLKVSSSPQLFVPNDKMSITYIKLLIPPRNFEILPADKDTCDVTLQVKDKVFKAHKDILMARSIVFTAMFKNDMSEKQTGIVNISDCDPDAFKDFLEFLSSGKIENISYENIVELYKMSDKYCVEALASSCVEYFKQYLSEENMCELLELADTYQDKLLINLIKHFFRENMKKVVVTTKWENLLKENPQLANKLIIDISSKVYAGDRCCCGIKRFKRSHD